MIHYREDLDEARCDVDDCTCQEGGLFLAPQCHPGGKLDAHYENGTMRLVCGQCGRSVIELEIARRPR